MKPASLGIRLSQPGQLDENGVVVDLPYSDIEISGNRAGLLKLAEEIRRIAESERETHTHFYPDDDPPLIRTKEFSLTIDKNSLK